MKTTANDTRVANEVKKVAKRVRCPYTLLPGEFLIEYSDTTTFTVSAGRTLDSTGQNEIELSDITKTIDTFAFGDGNGARVYDTITSGGYCYVFAISNGVTSDIIISESFDSPEIPNSSYWFRRIGSLVFNGTILLQFLNNNREYLSYIYIVNLAIGVYISTQSFTVTPPPLTTGIFELCLKRVTSTAYSTSTSLQSMRLIQSGTVSSVNDYSYDVAVNGIYQAAVNEKRVFVPSNRTLSAYYRNPDSYLYSSVYFKGWEDKDL